MYGIAKLSIIPVRLENSDKSEMVTQLLFGETYSIIKEDDRWLKVKLDSDGYEGWIDKFQHSKLSREEFEKNTINNTFKTIEISQNVFFDTFNFPVLIGSSLPLYNRNASEFFFYLENEKWKTNFQPLEIIDFKDFLFLKQICLKYLNAPYLWGGRSIFGIDCSGFTQQVFSLSGYELKRDSSEQVKQGDDINFLERLPGDLAFFNNKDGKIIHVGILLEKDQIIHASSKVKINNLDKTGIWCDERKKYSHFLHSIKRILKQSIE